VARAHECGASYILASFGMTLRESQPGVLLHPTDRLFPACGSSTNNGLARAIPAAANKRAAAGTNLSRTMWPAMKSPRGCAVRGGRSFSTGIAVQSILKQITTQIPQGR